MLLKIKRLLNKLGYDIKKYHSVFETTILPLDIKTIIDIGANTGAYSKHMRTQFPKAMIYAFEPLPDCYQKLITEMSRDPHFKAYNFALGENSGKIQINRSNFHPSSSILPMADLHKNLYPKSSEGHQENIEIRSMDDILENENMLENILIKIDVQGFEEKVIAGGRLIIEKAAVVVVETSFVELYQNQPLFDDIYQSLRQSGFKYYGDMGRHYAKETGELIYEDSLFIKESCLKNIFQHVT